MSKKRTRIIIGLIVVLMAANIFWLFFGNSGGDSNDEVTDITVSQDVTGTVSVANVQDFSQWIVFKDFSETEKKLYERVKNYSNNTAPSYTGTIRESSFETKYGPYDDGDTVQQIPNISFIVDIPDAKQSYFITQSGGEDYPYAIEYILCPTKEQLRYGAFGCKDEG